MPKLETPRLLLLPLTRTDAPAIQRGFAKWEIVRWMSARVPWPYPEDGAATFLDEIVLPAMSRGEAWHWSIRPREAPDLLIGVISLREEAGDNRGFWLDTAWQGRGLTTEASNAVTDFWFEGLGKAVLRAPKAVGNLPSRRISEKQGMRVVARFQQQMVSGPQEVELWEITRDEWLATRSEKTTPTN